MTRKEMTNGRPDTAKVLVTENLTMQFGGVVAVDKLNVVVHEGEIVALIGPNGAGKTTAFNVITGVYTPTNGRVRLFDRIIAENRPRGKMKALYKGDDAGQYKDDVVLTPDKITKLGVARTFQNIRLFKSLSVFENVLIAHHTNLKAGVLRATFGLNRKEEKDMHEKSMDLLSIVGLDHLADEVSGSLPYGMQRRLEIARALATEPKLLLLDEPAAGMNPQETLDLMAFIRDIKDRFGLTIFMIEHHMNLVMGISDRIYVIDFGRQIAEGTPVEIQANPDVIRAYLGVDE